jgi:Ca2+-binding EF-hand superfamily protein
LQLAKSYFYLRNFYQAEVELNTYIKNIESEDKNVPQLEFLSQIQLNPQDFVDAINNKLGDKESKEGIERIFNLFIDDPNQETITLNSLRRIARELGEQMSSEELQELLERASSNGKELTFEEFYDIMTKKSFP